MTIARHRPIFCISIESLPNSQDHCHASVKIDGHVKALANLAKLSNMDGWVVIFTEYLTKGHDTVLYAHVYGEEEKSAVLSTSDDK